MKRLVPAGLLTVALHSWIARLGPAGESLWTFQALFALAFVVYLVAVAATGSRGIAESTHQARSDRRWWAWVVAVAVLCRVAVLPMPASDDVYRYLWEGRAQSLGLSPYVVAPRDAPAVLGHDLSGDPYLGRVNHPHLTTIYPPLAELWFRAVAHVHYSERFWKLALWPWELLLVAALVRLLRRQGWPKWRALVYLWNPLVLVAVAGEGHVDVMMLAAAVWGLVWLSSPVRAGLALGMAVAAKLVMGVLAPVFLLHGGQAPPGAVRADEDRRGPSRRTRPGRRAYAVRFGLAAGVTLAALFVPFAESGRGLLSILLHFGVEMGHNGSMHALLVGPLGREGATQAAAAVFCGLALALMLALRDPVTLAQALVAAFLLCSPSVHPWYVVWLVPFLVLRPHPALLLWTGTVGAAYAAYGLRAATGEFHLTPALRLWIYLPVYGGLALRAGRGLVGLTRRFLRPSW